MPIEIGTVDVQLTVEKGKEAIQANQTWDSLFVRTMPQIRRSESTKAQARYGESPLGARPG
jgi:hypothetical protein